MVMINVKDYIGKCLVNKKVRFKCECAMPFDITGIVTSYSVSNNEVIWNVESIENHKQIKIGENTPKLSIGIL